MVLWRPTRSSSTNTKKDAFFIIEDWNAKAGSQEILEVTGKFGLKSEKWTRSKAKRVLPREHTGHSKYPFPTTHGHYQMVNTKIIDYILCSQRWRSSKQSTKIRPGADWGSGHEFLIAKFRLKLKKVGKTTRPFRYDLSQIPTIIQL